MLNTIIPDICPLANRSGWETSFRYIVWVTVYAPTTKPQINLPNKSNHSYPKIYKQHPIIPRVSRNILDHLLPFVTSFPAKYAPIIHPKGTIAVMRPILKASSSSDQLKNYRIWFYVTLKTVNSIPLKIYPS